jgi:hypothetical protein
MNALQRMKDAVAANGRSLILLFVTYIPAAIGAAYLSHWLWGTYLLGFIVGGAYMLWLLVIGVRVLLAVNRTA